MSRKSRRVDTVKRGKFNEILEQAMLSTAETLVAEFKLLPDLAKDIAACAMGCFQRHTGGTGVYVSKGHLWFIDETHRHIYSRFTGSNHAQLAREFNLTERQIYNIIAAIGEQEFQRRQPNLFEAAQ
ncbi:MAG: hypothetical protein HXX17_11855 [Geobacteraceae bacterium]|nr:hypothetical protein [Geobacteraceae bacterium]